MIRALRQTIAAWQATANAHVEWFNRTVSHEWLLQHDWADLQEIQMFATQWMWKYDDNRPNKVRGSITPKQRLAMAA